jgi:hypothetical protein
VTARARAALVATALVAAVACRRAPEPDATDRRPEAAAAQLTVDPRDQHALARDIAAADALDDGARADRYDAIRRDWTGKRVRWRVGFVPAMCRTAGRCNVLAFDRSSTSSPGRRVVQGWMPRLQLAAESDAALRAACASHARCAVDVEATVAALTLSTEEFTAVELAEPRILAATSR